ncbi:hypothetical protein POJ06DRAFT_31870 [Lipomyces tetrasporus]|uniref:RRM domain-containing protein n=1 Tax=Lipomyces tetrasporus TaxID=54092 RepID=A0AAD7QM06_9ASCO|nr:uncharacterized protein POJ06DRAFT_31870 [Lipomyces tetrasporus]KAJ8097440.1 hypothetical protein POJ06DRAFT_31870 [Lipomyces tetrasporus]
MSNHGPEVHPPGSHAPNGTNRAPVDDDTLFTEEDAERLGTLIEAVVTTPYKYTNHVELVELLKRAGPGAFDDELRDARLRMAGLFLMDENFWEEWIDDEASKREEKAEASGGVYDDEDTIKLLELHARSVNDLLSVPLWKGYVEFVMNEHEREKKEGRPAELSMFEKSTLENVLVEAVNATGYSIPDSHEIWDLYRDLKLRDVQASPSADNIALLKRYYLARFKVPHATIDQTFADYSTFITQHENHSYEEELVAANKKVYETKKLLAVFQPFEDHLATAQNDVNVWAQYIDAAVNLHKKQFDPEIPKALYERAIKCSPAIAAIWDNYVLYLLEHQNFQLLTIDAVLERAVKACPRSGNLWAHMIRTRERFKATAELIEEAKDRAVATGLLSTNAEEYSIMAAAWISYLRRKYANDLDENRLVFSGQVEAVMADFDQTFPRKNRKDQTYILPRMYIAILTQLGEIAKARQQWQDLANKHARDADFWLRWYNWERNVSLASGDVLTSAGVLETAVGIKSLDAPERICEALLEFERDYGSAFSMEKAEVKVKKLMRVVQRRRAMEAAKAPDGKTSLVAPVTGDSDAEEESKVSKRKGHGDEPEKPNPKKARTESDLSAPARDREHATVIVEGLPTDVNDRKVSNFFKDCGEIKSLKIVTSDTFASATIEFETAENVLAAQTRDQKVLDGHTITVRVGAETTLWITNFPSAADDEYIRKVFAPFGEIVDIRFPSLTVNNKRRFCYLQYKRPEDAHAAQQTLDDSPAPPVSSATNQKETSKPRKLIVKISDPSQKQHRQGAVYEGRELFVRNIPMSMKEPDIRRMFSKYGPLERVHLPSKDELFHTHQGFGFVSYENAEDAKNGLELDMTKIGDRILSVTVAEARTSGASRGGRAGFGGRGRGRGRGSDDSANRADHRARRI